jgi:hypothetical protein
MYLLIGMARSVVNTNIDIGRSHIGLNLVQSGSRSL